ncbi:hypothetical protein HPP92_028153 [Vanilla planifolia]|uniref:NAD(P)H dehydrogenase (quinone) n=1 Tax=Vanilla planifolia TaxID=51239 RepID=A0A835U352_VANPL|nr:hypothetical protein HPP92_028153 [Vanilla planifolia]
MSGKERECREATTALFEICKFPGNRRRAVRAGAVPHLVLFASNGSERAVQVLGLLAKCKEGRDTMVSVDGFVRVLAGILREGTTRGMEHALLVLNLVCSENVNLCWEAKKEGVREICFVLVEKDHEKIARNALALARTLEKRGGGSFGPNGLIAKDAADADDLNAMADFGKLEVAFNDEYYSTYGHVEKLAHEISRGASSVEGVEVKLWQVPETLSEEILGKMGAPPKSDVPIISANELAEADGFLFGFPTRFGMMAAQFKAFLDSTGGLWRTQQLAGKPAGIFYSTGSQGGGQETTPLTAITQLAHHGMIFVPVGYTGGAGMFEMDKVRGGSPYGAGTFAGDGSRQPTELELQLAFHQGQYFAGVAKKFKGSS